MVTIQGLEDFAVNAIVAARQVVLWAVIAGPFALGIVAGALTRFSRLVWAAIVEGYRIGVGNA